MPRFIIGAFLGRTSRYTDRRLDLTLKPRVQKSLILKYCVNGFSLKKLSIDII